MPPKKKSSGEGLASLVRDAGQRAKQAVEQRQLDAERLLEDPEDIELVVDEVRPFKPRIFNILEYIEQAWGLAMRLYPSQRFLVKLYYNLPLEEKEKTIEVRDMFATKILYHFTELEYLHYLYSEGRCNIGEQDHERRELVLAIGRRGGKCVSGDTLTLTGNGLFRIDALATAPEDGFSDYVTTVAQEAGRLGRSVAFYNGGVKPTYSIRSRSGYSIRGTGAHRIKVLTQDGVVDWCYLDEIKVGDIVAINRTTDLWAKDKLDLRSYHNTDRRKDVDLPGVLDERLGALLGYLVGDGTWNDDHSTALTVEHPETWERLRILMDSVFGECRTQMDKRTANTGRLEFCSVRARRFLHAIGFELGTARDAKMVPWSVLRSPKTVVQAFLSGLFETDGCAEDAGRKITLSTASFRLAHEVQVLLLNLGIVSSVNRKWNTKHRRHYAILTIKGHRSRELFVRTIGFESEKKQQPVVAYLASKAQDGKSDTDSVPHQHRHIRDLLESIPKRNPAKGEFGWGRSKLREVLGNSCKPGSGEAITYNRMQRVVSIGKELDAGRAEIAHFEKLISMNYFFDEVVYVEEGEDQVYDLTVPDGESFVANGFTNHNTTLSGVFASYEVYRLLNLYNPQQYYGLPNGNRIQIISVATDKDQASILFNEVTSHLAKCEYFRPHIANNTLSHIQFRTPYDIEKYGPTARQQNGKFVSFNGKATLRVTFKSSNAKGLRGPGNIVVILDEMAHFVDKGQSSAKDIYDAVTPSTAAYSPKGEDGMPMKKGSQGETYPVESRIISISSPLNRNGKFYELFHLAMSKGPGSENMLAVQAPTWEVNPTVTPGYYRQKYHADPAVFMTEHGAQFSDRVRGWIEREVDLVSCASEEARPQIIGIPRYPYQMGIDIGLIGDGSAVAITCMDNDRIVLAYHEYWQAGVDWRESNPHLGINYITDYSRTLENVERLELDEIAEWIYRLSKRFYITDGLFDRWNGLPLEQSLMKRGLTQFKSEFFTPELSSRIYQNTKMFMFDRRLSLYDYPKPSLVKHSAFIEELLNLQAQQRTRNIVIVKAPQTAGYHDDRSDAFVRAVWLTTERMRNEKHVYGASIGMSARGGALMTAGRYQAARARSHGGFSERTVPRNLGLHGRILGARLRAR